MSELYAFASIDEPTYDLATTDGQQNPHQGFVIPEIEDIYSQVGYIPPSPFDFALS